MNDNKSFNELVHYIDHDLLEVLTEGQRDTIYALAATSIALKERHDTLAERTSTAVSALNREGMDFGKETPPEYGMRYWYRQHLGPILYGSAFIIVVISSSFFIF